MYEQIIEFWFEELEPAQWWKKDAAFDALLKERFANLHGQAAAAELYDWRTCAEGRLAEIIILDQFSRNMYRDTPRAFAQDGMALALAQEAVAHGADQALSPAQRSFLYMPYMHSESLRIHQAAEALYRQNGVQSSFDFEMKHKRIIERFGRYPHRNGILGRPSTMEEIEFLQQPGSGF